MKVRWAKKKAMKMDSIMLNNHDQHIELHESVPYTGFAPASMTSAMA